MSNPLFDDFFNLDLLTPSDTTANNDLFSYFLDNNEDLAQSNSASVDTDMALSSSTQTLDLNALLAAHKQSQKEQEAQTESQTTEAQNVLAQEPFSPSFTQQLLISPGSLVDFSTLAIVPSTLAKATASSAIPVSGVATATPPSAHSDISTIAANSVANTQLALPAKSTSPAKRPSPEPAEGARKQAKKEKTPPPKKASSSSSSSSSSLSSSSSKSSPVTLDNDDSLINTTLSAATLQFLLQKQMEAPLIPQLFTGTLSREEVEDTLAKLLESTKHLLQAPESTERPQDGDDDGHSSDGEHDDNNADNEKTTTHGGLKTQPGIKTDDIPSSSDLKKMTSKERRQLRNKISARNFRVRRKEYIGALEGQVLQHRTEAAHLREAVTIVNDENKRLKEELEEVKRQLSQATVSNASTSLTTAPVSQSQPQPTVSVTPISTTAASSSLSKDDQMLLSAILGRSPFNANAKLGMTLTLPTRPQSPIVTFNSQKDMPNSSALAKSGSWKDKGPMFVHSALVPEVTFGQDFQFSDKPGSSDDSNKPWELLWPKVGSRDDHATENPFASQSVVLELMQTFTMAMAMGFMSPEEMDVTPTKKTPGWMVTTDAKASVQDYESDKRVTEALEWELQQTLWEVVAARNKDQASRPKYENNDQSSAFIPIQEDPCMLEWLYESMMARLVAMDTHAVEVHSA